MIIATMCFWAIIAICPAFISSSNIEEACDESYLITFIKLLIACQD
jgi:hypothetical protein